MATVRQLKKPNREGKRAWVVTYTDPQGKRVQATPPSGLKRDAEALRIKIMAEVTTGVHIADRDALTVRELGDRYVRHIEDKRHDGRIGRTHYDQLKNGVDRSIIPHFGRWKVTDLTAVAIEEWYRKLVREDGLSPTTARGRVHLLRSMEAFANRRGLMKARPAGEAAFDLRTIRAKPIRTLDADQVGKLLALVSKAPLYGDDRQAATLACFVNLAAFCGLRFGEINGLTLSNVDLANQTVHVRHNLTVHDELKCPKTPAGVRDIPLPAHLCRMLRAWHEAYDVPNERRLLFRIANGGQVSSANFHGRMWKPLLKRAGLSGPDWPHFHALRHFAASWMIANHMPVTEVASLLGHSHFDMTLQVYAHPVAGGARRLDAIEKMSTSLLQITDASPVLDATSTRSAALTH